MKNFFERWTGLSPIQAATIVHITRKIEGKLMKQLTLSITALLLAGSSALAADWGTIKGSVILKGDIPAPVLMHAKGANIKDGEVCAKEDTYKDDLVVNKENGGIANVFVYLRRAPKDIHPEAAKPAPKVIFDQENCVFKPHALVVQAPADRKKPVMVEVLNSDPIAHNTHTYPLRNQAFNILVAPNTAAGAGAEIKIHQAEPLPHQVKCDFHPWMEAYWLVVDHPYAAATDENGNFTIENLPVGKHSLTFWHERSGYVERSYSVTVTAGENPELKPLMVDISKLEEK